jgi:hypothetical protein
METSKDTMRNFPGRYRIESNKRTRFSKRAAMGQITVEREEFICPSCHHDKGITWTGKESPRFYKTKCAKCKKVKE